MNEIEKLAEIIMKFEMACKCEGVACPDGSECYACEAKAIIDAGYLPVEPVEIEGLTFSKDEIVGLIPAQAFIDYDRAKEVLELVSQATIDKIKQQGTIYRRKQ